MRQITKSGQAGIAQKTFQYSQFLDLISINKNTAPWGSGANSDARKSGYNEFTGYTKLLVDHFHIDGIQSALPLYNVKTHFIAFGDGIDMGIHVCENAFLRFHVFNEAISF